MIISPGRKYIFVHIPKTGGTALTMALEARAMKDDLIIADTPKARARQARLKSNPATAQLRKHTPLADLGGMFTPVDLGGFFCFTLVRNPWDRLVSYYHWLRMQRFHHPAVILAKATDFAAFLTHPSTVSALSRWPAAAYMTDSSGHMRANAYVRIEHLAHDITLVEAHLGFSLLPLPHHNVSARGRDWRAYYSDADAALIAQVCAQDIADFGYRFDPENSM